MSAFGQLIGPGVPDPENYADWREWARDLGQLADTTQNGLTQAAVENLLNYNVGPWAPTLVGSVTPGTYGLAPSGTARYVQIASLVVVMMKAVVTVSVAGAGDIVIGGLPKPMLASSVALGVVSLGDLFFPQQLLGYAASDALTIAGLGTAMIVDGNTIGLTMSYLTKF